MLGLLERNEAQLLIDFQNRRGGTTKLGGIPAPEQVQCCYMNVPGIFNTRQQHVYVCCKCPLTACELVVKPQALFCM